MKLLLDQNQSPLMLDALESAFPGSTHVRLAGLSQAGDEEVWEFARREGFAIVSKDSDFHQRSFLFGFPPKVIWIRLGNCSTAAIQKLFERSRQDIVQFLDDEGLAFLASPDRRGSRAGARAYRSETKPGFLRLILMGAEKPAGGGSTRKAR